MTIVAFDDISNCAILARRRSTKLLIVTSFPEVQMTKRATLAYVRTHEKLEHATLVLVSISG